MSLETLALELEETARQSAEMAAGCAAALARLATPGDDAAAARREAVATIVVAMQAQDRIEQRCRDLARAARQFERAGARVGAGEASRIWAGLTLDELRRPGTAATVLAAGEPELF